MATRVKLETKGLAEYLEAIAKAGKNVDQAVDKALKAGGTILLSGMQRRVSKDTGHLAASLSMDGPHQDGNYHFILIGLNHPDAETARYALAQEYGWGPDHPGKPYIRPALDEDKRKAVKAMKDVLVEELGIE